jgi:hypothetical protein
LQRHLERFEQASNAFLKAVHADRPSVLLIAG